MDLYARASGRAV